MNQRNMDEKWMKVALEEAKRAMNAGEHPIACIVVAGDSELTRGQTSVARQGTITAHGELLALRDSGWSICSAQRPVIIYTTLEPCLMCIGAAMQCGVDEIVYAMPAKPDGGAKHISAIARAGDKPPRIRFGVLEDEAVKLMRENLIRNPSHPGLEYCKALLAGLEQ